MATFSQWILWQSARFSSARKMWKSIYSTLAILTFSVKCWECCFQREMCFSCFSWPGWVCSYFPVALCDGSVFLGGVPQLLFEVIIVTSLWDSCKFRGTLVKVKILQKATIPPSSTFPVVKSNIIHRQSSCSVQCKYIFQYFKNTT